MRSMIFVGAGAVTLLGLALAQMSGAPPRVPPQQKVDHATMHLRCNLGSFKTLPQDPTGSVEGTFDVSFSGSLLVSGLDGDIQISGDLVKEFDEIGRQVYHGTGRAVVTGKWRALQWFGSDMEAVWHGTGLINLSGEFDKDLKTGEFWYDDPEQKGYWPTSMTPFLLPEQKFGILPGVDPQKRGEGGN